MLPLRDELGLLATVIYRSVVPDLSIYIFFWFSHYHQNTPPEFCLPLNNKMYKVHILLLSHCSSSHLHIHILCSYLEHILKAPFDASLHTFHKVDTFQIQNWQRNSLHKYIQRNESEYQGVLLLHIPQRNRVLHHIQGMTSKYCTPQDHW